MTKREKELLTKVLCEQLPYGVMCDRLGVAKKLLSVSPYKVYCLEFDNGEYTPSGFKLEDIKPYLRPLSSITEDEMEELKKLQSGLLWRKDVLRDIVLELWYSTDAFDYLNAKHFDIRGLIPMGLAIAAVGESNPYKEKGGAQC